MMTTAASTATDRSDFRTVMIAGTKTGALIALAVVVFLAATRVLGPGGGAARALVQALVRAVAGEEHELYDRELYARRRADATRNPATPADVDAWREAQRSGCGGRSYSA